MKTLLERAMAVDHKHAKLPPTDEQIALAKAWAKDQITLGQVMSVLGGGSSKAYIMLARSLREVIRRNRK